MGALAWCGARSRHRLGNHEDPRGKRERRGRAWGRRCFPASLPASDGGRISFASRLLARALIIVVVTATKPPSEGIDRDLTCRSILRSACHEISPLPHD